MKSLFLLLSFFLIFSCEKKEEFVQAKNPVHQIFVASSEDVVNDFIDFRKAVYQNDLKKMKKYIDFPFQSKDACFLINENFEKETISEEDFNKFHTKIFDKMFIESILKVKTLELLEKGKTTTQDLKLGNETFRMTASFEKPDALLLNIASETFVKDLDWKPEHNRIYEFEVENKGKLKLIHIYLAG